MKIFLSHSTLFALAIMGCVVSADIFASKVGQIRIPDYHDSNYNFQAGERVTIESHAIPSSLRDKPYFQGQESIPATFIRVTSAKIARRRKIDVMVVFDDGTVSDTVKCQTVGWRGGKSITSSKIKKGDVVVSRELLGIHGDPTQKVQVGERGTVMDIQAHGKIKVRFEKHQTDIVVKADCMATYGSDYSKNPAKIDDMVSLANMARIKDYMEVYYELKSSLVKDETDNCWKLKNLEFSKYTEWWMWLTGDNGIKRKYKSVLEMIHRVECEFNDSVKGTNEHPFHRRLQLPKIEKIEVTENKYNDETTEKDMITMICEHVRKLGHNIQFENNEIYF